MAKRSFKRFVEQELGKFPHFLIYAVLEWFLIIVLFIDGFLAFFANEFSRFFELKIPCLLCTRIDHVLVHRDADFYYNDSICESHKKDVSFLAYCHVHKKLSDIRKMCEGCLLSFATQKETDCDSDTYKSLVGILHKDVELFVDDDSEVHLTLPTGRNVQAEKNSLYGCSCCGEPLKVKSHLRGRNAGVFSQAPAPSPRAPFATLRNEEHRSMDLPHIRYTELKFSDNESELQDDEDGSHLGKQFREDVKSTTVPLLTEAEDINEDRTPIFAKGNKFFGIPLTDSANVSPRWAPSRFPRKSPLEKTEFASAVEHVEGGSAASEADGDSILHHLKRQVRLDRKSLMALYMELDEERSASAIAANNAMAMITRLQAEKAAVQMEALQYQRMMEEQAEYDQEALQATNEMLAKREEEIKVLQAELEAYREKYGFLPEVEGFVEFEDEVEEDYRDLRSELQLSYTERSECVSPTYSSTHGNNDGENILHNDEENVHNPDDQSSSLHVHNTDDQSSSLPEEKGETTKKFQRNFQEGKSRRLGRLKNLDKKLQLTADDGIPSSRSSSDNVNHMEEETEGKASIMKELSHLHERVKALEADGGFSKHAGGGVRNGGSEKSKILNDISDNLQKLRHVMASRMDDHHDV